MAAAALTARGSPLRVLVVTGDPSLAASVRRDGRVALVAHVDDPAVARTLAAASAADAILADEASAPSLGGCGLPVHILRPAVEWGPASVPPAGLPEAQPAPPRAFAEAAPGRQPTLRDWWEGSRPAGAPARPAPRAPEVLMRQAIAVISPKGGVGKTFVSVNLASSLARHTGFRVVLLDLDLRSGDAAVHLDLVGRPTLAELAPYAGSIRAEHVARAVVQHPATHLDVLLAPARAEAAETFGRDHVGALVRLLKQTYDFVVIDTPPDPEDPLVAACLEEATAVVLVSSLDAAALRQCRIFLESASSRGREQGRRKTHLVLNQVHDSGPLPAARAAGFLEAALPGTALGDVTTICIPENRPAVEKAVYEGRPIVLTDPSHPLSRSVFELAQAFCPVFGGLIGESRPRRSGLARFVDVLRRW